MDRTIKTRDYGFDNIKFILIILVVLGHILEEISTTGFMGVIRSVIYSFHMPLFVFISGYFSRMSKRKTERAFAEYLIPFFIFNTIYTMTIQGVLKVNIFLPQYAFWYLLSLFFWNISIDYIYKFKPIIIVSFILGIYCGLFGNIDRVFSLSRTICFFPFFILGYSFDKEKTEKLRSLNKALPVIGIALSVGLTAFANIKGYIPIKMYEMIQSYNNTKVDNIPGGIERAVIYLIAVLMIVCVISLVPNKEFWFTKYGTRTVCIYIFSSFLIKICFMIFKAANISAVYNNPAIAIALSAALLVGIILITGNKWVNLFYCRFIELIKKFAMNP